MRSLSRDAASLEEMACDALAWLLVLQSGEYIRYLQRHLCGLNVIAERDGKLRPSSKYRTKHTIRNEDRDWTTNIEEEFEARLESQLNNRDGWALHHRLITAHLVLHRLDNARSEMDGSEQHLLQSRVNFRGVCLAPDPSVRYPIALFAPRFLACQYPEQIANMVVRIRLARFGNRHQPFYNIVVQHTR